MGLGFVTPKLSEVDVSRILRDQYGLGAEGIVKTLSARDPSAITYCSNSFVVGIEGGEVIVKEIILEGSGQDSVYKDVKADIADFLIENGVSVARHYRTNEGKSFGDFEGHSVEVLEYYPDVKSYEFGNRGQVSQAARNLAEFNHALSCLGEERPEVYERLSEREDLFGTTREDLERILGEDGLVGKLSLAAETVGGNGRDVMHYMDDVRRVVGDWRGGLSGGDAIIHRDLHGNNVIYRKDDGSFKAILDFDTICVGPRLYDLGYAGLFFSSDIPHPFETPDRDLFDLFERIYKDSMSSLSRSSEEGMSGREALKSMRRDMVNRTSAVVVSRYLNREEVGDGPIVNHLGIHKRMRDLEIGI